MSILNCVRSKTLLVSKIITQVYKLQSFYARVFHLEIFYFLISYMYLHN